MFWQEREENSTVGRVCEETTYILLHCHRTAFEDTPVPTTNAEFFDYLSESGILPPQEVEALKQSTPQETLNQDCTALSRKLVQRGKLTDYQAACLGRGDLQAVLFREYIALEQIGQGGMAVVFRAVHRETGKIVAIKLAITDGSEDKEQAYRFEREVIAASKLSHPNIVVAYDSVHTDERNYLVMEYVDGPTLERYVTENGPLPLDEALDYLYQAACGLEHAHFKRMVHRDIKPDNMLLSSDGTLKILDMGLVRFDDRPGMDKRPEEVERLTQMGTMLGTADYMSPEQSADPRQADYRSDIYSLGCTFYFMLTGRPPYCRDTTMGTLMAHQTEPIPDIRKDRPEVPDDVQAFFERMVAKTTRTRIQEMGQVVERVDQLLEEYGDLVEEDTHHAGSSGDSASTMLTAGVLGGLGGGLLGALLALFAPMGGSALKNLVERLSEPLGGIGFVAFGVYGLVLGIFVGLAIGMSLPTKQKD